MLAGMNALLLAALVFGGLSDPSRSRQLVKIVKVDDETLVLTCREEVETVYIDDFYQNTDYFMEHDPEKGEYRFRLLTGRGPLKFIVETFVPRTKGLRRRHVYTVLNPKRR
jgi:hypothetical protein